MTPGLLIAGGGLAAQRCCEVLRSAGDDRPVTVLGTEPVRPYDRPPLSKELPAGDVAFRPAAWYAEHAITLRLGAEARGLDPVRRVVALAGGERVPPRDRRHRIEAAPRPLSGILGPRAAAWLTALHRSRGVVVRTGTTVARVHGNASVEALELSDGTRVACAHVLVGVGVRPATRWLAGSGLDPAGVLVDEAGRTALPGVFAAGDAACRPDPRTGRPVAGGHWESASREGAAVAAALLGRPARPAGPPSFWSDQHGIRLQCVGDPRDAEEVLAHGDLAGDCFELDHLRDGRITAVLLAGRPPSALRAARARLHVPHIPVRSAA